jgi:hypothetical protein
MCGAQRKDLLFEPVSNNKNQTAIYVSCEECLTAIVFFVSQNEMGVMTVGVLTDLNSNEAKSFFGSKAISTNDIIDVYEHLYNSKESILVINNK